MFEEFDIQAVINLAKARGRDTVDEDYVARRNAVDFGIVVSRLDARDLPMLLTGLLLQLINNAQCAQLFVEALAKKIPQGGLEPYTEGNIPSEVKVRNQRTAQARVDRRADQSFLPLCRAGGNS